MACLTQPVVQILRFGMIGVAATLTHLVSALVLNEVLGVSVIWSNFTAFLIAWPISYMGNFFWTFETSATHLKSMPRFVITSLTGLSVSQLIVWFVAGVMGQGLRIALVPALIIVPALSFLMSRYWVFLDDNPAPSARKIDGY